MKGLNRVAKLKELSEAIESQMNEMLASKIESKSESVKSIVLSKMGAIDSVYWSEYVDRVVELSEKRDFDGLAQVEREIFKRRKHDFNERNEFDYVTTKKMEAEYVPANGRVTRRERRRG